MSESDSFPNPKIEITADMDENMLLAAWQMEKGVLLQRDRERSYEKAKRAVAAWRHQPLLHMGQIPSLQELGFQLEKFTRGQVENHKDEWVDDMQSFRDFLKMIAEKKKIDEGKLDLSTPNYAMGPTSSAQLFRILLESEPYVEKAIKYVQEIVEVYDERLKFFTEQEAQVPMWRKQAEGLANSAKKPAQKINELIMQAKELRRTNQREKALKTLEKAVPLMGKYKHIDTEFSELSAKLHTHNVPLPYFPTTITEDKLKELLRQR